MMAIKDKNKPKGAKSPYACFVQAFREEQRRAFPNETVGFAEFSKKCAVKWKELTPEERKQFEEIANKDKERYQIEMQAYLPPGRRSLKRRRDPNMPKRGLSAFFCFCDSHRAEVKSKHPEWRVGDVAKEMGKLWEQCKDKSRFEEAAHKDKARYEREMETYKSVAKAARLEAAQQARQQAASQASSSHNQTAAQQPAPSHQQVQQTSHNHQAHTQLHQQQQQQQLQQQQQVSNSQLQQQQQQQQQQLQQQQQQQQQSQAHQQQQVQQHVVAHLQQSNPLQQAMMQQIMQPGMIQGNLQGMIQPIQAHSQQHQSIQQQHHHMMNSGAVTSMQNMMPSTQSMMAASSMHNMVQMPNMQNVPMAVVQNMMPQMMGQGFSAHHPYIG